MVKNNKEKKKPILYLAQAYSKYEQVPRDAYDEHEAYALAINTYWTLTKRGFEVFSPIMYTHPFHVAMKCPPLDYVAHDLQIIDGFMKNDVYVDRDRIPISMRVSWQKYDSGVCCVFADDCFEPCLNRVENNPVALMIQGVKFWHKWVSSGAKAEYDFAHAHHIRCIRLTELLEKHKIEECEPF